MAVPNLREVHLNLNFNLKFLNFSMLKESKPIPFSDLRKELPKSKLKQRFVASFRRGELHLQARSRIGKKVKRSSLEEENKKTANAVHQFLISNYGELLTKYVEADSGVNLTEMAQSGASFKGRHIVELRKTLNHLPDFFKDLNLDSVEFLSQEEKDRILEGKDEEIKAIFLAAGKRKEEESAGSGFLAGK